MFKKLASAFKTTPLVIALVLTFGLSYAYAAWSEPTATPPGGNVAAPINTGSAAQTKTGSLGVGSANAPAHTLEVNGAVSLNGYYSGEPNSSGGLILNHSTGVSGKEASIEYYGSGRSIIGPDGNEQSIAFRFINDNDGIGFVNNTVSRNISLYGYINSVPVTPLTFDSSGNTTVNGKATASDFCTTSGKCLSASGGANIQGNVTFYYQASGTSGATNIGQHVFCALSAYGQWGNNYAQVYKSGNDWILYNYNGEINVDGAVCLD